VVRERDLGRRESQPVDGQDEDGVAGAPHLGDADPSGAGGAVADTAPRQSQQLVEERARPFLAAPVLVTDLEVADHDPSTLVGHRGQDMAQSLRLSPGSE